MKDKELRRILDIDEEPWGCAGYSGKSKYSKRLDYIEDKINRLEDYLGVEYKTKDYTLPKFIKVEKEKRK